ncbi:hypothetical protein N8D56_19250 [Devosia sp. A8/3-2]|nr:hypothetical protein N8D56_19250 [Devosia sp. A8/3-2]
MAQSALTRSERINGWLFVMPALVLLGIFMVYPILWSLWMSFRVGRGMNFSFGGFANIMRLTQDPVFLRAQQYDAVPGHAGADHAGAGVVFCQCAQ